jgi:hypothetical protein
MRHNPRDSHFRHYTLAPPLKYFAEPISLRFLNYATFQYLYLFTGVLEEGVYKPGPGGHHSARHVLARTTRRRTKRRLMNEIHIGTGDRENIMK